jgi:HAD superfamily hydrolase (TIGR01509 family)
MNAKKYRAVVFDMDGVLVLSEPVHFKAWEITLAQCGIPKGSVKLEDILGVADPEMASDFHRRFNTSLKPAELCKMKEEIFLELVPAGFQLLEGRDEFLKYLKQRMPVGLVSSSSSNEVDLILQHQEMDGYFDFKITGTDVGNPKPDPEPYQKALARLELEPKDVLVVEDSPSGIKAAKQAGLDVVVMCNEQLAKEASTLCFQTFNCMKNWFQLVG